MGEFFPLLGNWFWFVTMGLLLFGELFLPGVFFIWLALAAAAVGLLDLVFDFGWRIELIVFAALSVIGVFGGRQLLRRRHVLEGDRPSLNQRMYDFVGRSYVLDEPIVEGRGRLTIDSTIWDVRGPDAPAGTRVTVTGIDGLRLNVARA
jgi:hypothetical protein